MYSPGYTITVPPMVSAFTKGIGWMAEDISTTAAVSATWETTNRTVYGPLIIPATCVVRRVWWVNGATTTGGATVQVGIYADLGYGPGAKLISGSATQGTASNVQFVDVTDTVLPAGLYWTAITASTNTDTEFFRVQIGGGSIAQDAAFRFQQAGAMPATATPVETTNTNADFWVCGFATTASP